MQTKKEKQFNGILFKIIFFVNKLVFDYCSLFEIKDKLYLQLFFI